MLHRPAHLLCILSGFYHFMPLLQCLFCISSRPFQNCFGTGISWRTHIVATHILTSYMLCDIQLSFIFGLSCQNNKNSNPAPMQFFQKYSYSSSLYAPYFRRICFKIFLSSPSAALYFF